ncbi:MAG TPA: hypothetical protein VJU60_03525 [Thermoleophilaceae bacterium]|nr:hypothetical protein [Thermoleophilaceae bacterium]
MARRYTLIVFLSLAAAALLPCAAQAAFPGVNGRIQFSRGSNTDTAHIYSIDPSGHNERQLTFGLNALDEDGSWSADGTRIVFQRCSDTSFTSCGVVVMNADGSGGVTLTPIDAGNIDDYPVFSPDGSKIAFIRQTSPTSCCDVMVMNADGSDAHSIRTMYSSTTVDGPSWSPDGTRIAYIDPTGSLAVTNADGSGTPLPLHSPSSGYDETSDWSPDGSRIIFTAADPSNSSYYRIWSAPSDGSAPATELDPSGDPVSEDEPSFSPDGTKILFERYDPATQDEPIYMENADGSGAVRVTGEDDYAYRATWQPLHPAPPPPAPPAPRPAFAGISLVTHALTVSSKGVAVISESCPATTNGSCTGTLTLKTAGPVAAVAKHRKVKRRIVTLGRGKFSIPAGQTAKVRVRLTKTAFKVLQSNRKLRVLATVVSHDASGAAKTTSAKLTLRAPKARKKRRSHR